MSKQFFGAYYGNFDVVKSNFDDLIKRIKSSYAELDVKQFIITESPNRCILNYIVTVNTPINSFEQAPDPEVLSIKQINLRTVLDVLRKSVDMTPPNHVEYISERKLFIYTYSNLTKDNTFVTKSIRLASLNDDGTIYTIKDHLNKETTEMLSLFFRGVTAE